MSTVLTEEELDLATWPRICRPSDVYIERLAQAPWCPKCGRRTTWKARKEHSMCPSCWRVWGAPSLDDSLAAVSDEAAELIRQRRCAGTATANILAEVKRLYEPPAGRPWDATLVIMAGV